MTHARLSLVVLLNFVLLINFIKGDEIITDTDSSFDNHLEAFINSLNTQPSRLFKFKSGNVYAHKQENNALILSIRLLVECRDPGNNDCGQATQISCDATFTNSEPAQIVEQNTQCVSDPEGNQVQLIAPRRPNYCAGCPTDLNVDIPGVNAFTTAAVSHLNADTGHYNELIQVQRLQRQVLETVRSGVRYLLTIEVAESPCKEISDLPACQLSDQHKICEVTFLEKPKLETAKHIISNNCTIHQIYTTEPQLREESFSSRGKSNRNNEDNEIDVNFSNARNNEQSAERKQILNFEEIAQTGISDDILKIAEPNFDSSARIHDIESQIISNPQAPVEGQLNVPIFNDGVSEAHKTAIDGLLDAFSFSVEPMLERASSQSDSEATQELQPIEEPIIVPVRAIVSFEEAPNQTPKIETVVIGVTNTEEDTQQSEDKVISYISTRNKRELNTARSRLESTTDDEKYLVLNLAEIAVNTLDTIDTDNHKRVVLKNLSSEKSRVNGTIYHLTMKVGVSECAEDKFEDRTPKDLTEKKDYSLKDEECRKRIFNNLTMICKAQIYVTEQKTNPKVIKSQCTKFNKNTERSNRTGGRYKRQMLVGGKSPLDEESAIFKEYANQALNKMDELSSSPRRLKVVETKSATKQVVAGTLVEITFVVGESEIMKTTVANFEDRKKSKLLSEAKTKTCTVKVWDRPWLKNGREITLSCSDEDSVTFRTKRSTQKRTLGGDDHDINLGLFDKFIRTHNKVYPNKVEYKKRYHVFKANMKKVQILNENEKGTAHYGPTMFADLSENEFKAYLGLKPSLMNENNVPYPMASIPNNPNLPLEFDWRTKGVVTEVKNQGSCGSCWAFSVTGNIEGQYAIKNQQLIPLSEQELVDCDKLDDGCGGGLPDNAYRAIEQMGGLEIEQDYPYEGKNDKCVFDINKSRVQLSGAVNITHDEVGMAQWLFANGPISIGINANAMQFYMGGVSHPWKMLCDPTNLDHGVLVVGYGVHTNRYFKKTYPFWIIKNSWGPRWGEQGYYRVYRGDGTCGVNMMASSAVVAN